MISRRMLRSRNAERMRITSALSSVREDEE
jgi:hypothetical protein